MQTTPSRMRTRAPHAATARKRGGIAACLVGIGLFFALPSRSEAEPPVLLAMGEKVPKDFTEKNDSTRAAEKKERLLAALRLGMVMIHLDARRPGVLVPPSFRQEPHLRLNLSYRFDPPDLMVTQWGIRSTLSFSGSRFAVAVPWSALFAITSHVTKEFWMYPEDMPAEIIQNLPPKADGASEPKSSAKALLREVAVEPDAAPPPPPAEAPAAEKASEDPPKPRGRGHLRVDK